MENTDTQASTELLKDLGTKNNFEEQIRICLDAMRSCLHQSEKPSLDLRTFWETKKSCLSLFKEKLKPHARSILWKEYLELSEEAFRMKEVLDEQSLYAKEQIEIAIDAIEKQLSQGDYYEGMSLEIPRTMLKNKSHYHEAQKEIDVLNAFAARLNALRKELIPLSLRVQQKKSLFDRLSKLGDHVFPRRKELIQEISDLFVSDVTDFIEQKGSVPLFVRKEEIKALQQFAKSITISPLVFTQERQKLSEVWDEVKQKEKEEYQQRQSLRQESKEKLEKILPEVETFVLGCKDREYSLSLAREKNEALLKEIEGLGLGRDEYKLLKQKLAEAKRPLEEEEKKRALEAKEAQLLKDQQQRDKQEKFLNELGDVLNQAERLPFEALAQKWEAFVKEEKTLTLTGITRALVDHRLDALNDHLQEKNWQSLSEQSESEMASTLHALLEERHKSRRKVKERLEQHRKKVGGSGLNLEESMMYQQLIIEEKGRLDSIETVIEEIEEKLFDLEE